MAVPSSALLYLLPFPLLLLLVLSRITRPKPVRVPIKGRHVFITGGSSGIGLALARLAAARGARVSILARGAKGLEAARESIRRNTGADVAIYPADVRNAAAVREAVEAAGPIDVLVCNQGVFVPKEVEEQSEEDVRFTLDVNVVGCFNLIRAALPAMRREKDGLPRSIAIVSSQAGQVGVYGYTAYCASKFALRGLGESLQQEVISDNIHVSLVYPPDTETPGFEEELKSRPEITSLICGSSERMSADEVAKKSLEGIMSGSFSVSCNLEGKMLAVATAGCSPQRSPWVAFVEILSAGFMRFACLCFQYGWYTTIEKCKAKQLKN